MTCPAPCSAAARPANRYNTSRRPEDQPLEQPAFMPARRVVYEARLRGF